MTILRSEEPLSPTSVLLPFPLARFKFLFSGFLAYSLKLCSCTFIPSISMLLHFGSVLGIASAMVLGCVTRLVVDGTAVWDSEAGAALLVVTGALLQRGSG